MNDQQTPDKENSQDTNSTQKKKPSMTAAEIIEDDKHHWTAYKVKIAGGHVTESQIETAEILMEDARERLASLGGLPLMQADIGLFEDDEYDDCDCEGELQLSWDTGTHHFSLDIHKQGKIEWFWMRYSSQQYDGGSWSAKDSTGIPPEALARLKVLANSITDGSGNSDEIEQLIKEFWLSQAEEETAALESRLINGYSAQQLGRFAVLRSKSCPISITALAARYFTCQLYCETQTSIEQRDVCRFLYDILKTDMKPIIREGVVWGLADAGQTAELKTMLCDSDYRVRRAATEALEE